MNLVSTLAVMKVTRRKEEAEKEKMGCNNPLTRPPLLGRRHLRPRNDRKDGNLAALPDRTAKMSLNDDGSQHCMKHRVQPVQLHECAAAAQAMGEEAEGEEAEGRKVAAAAVIATAAAG